MSSKTPIADDYGSIREAMDNINKPPNKVKILYAALAGEIECLCTSEDRCAVEKYTSTGGNGTIIISGPCKRGYR